MGLGFGNATNAVEGFGILCMASIGPIIAVLTTGLWTRFQAYRQCKAAKRETEISHGEEADSVFNFIFKRANLAKPGRGIMWQTPLIGCTRFELPEDVADEKNL